MTTQTLHGVIDGSTIHLAKPSALPAGTQVRVIVIEEAVAQTTHEKLPPGEGIRQSYGGWKGDDEEGLEEYLEWTRQQRKATST